MANLDRPLHLSEPPDDHAPPLVPPIDCGQIQERLFDYLTRELGDGQSALIHEHLRHCPECGREAAALQSTLDLLHASDPATQAPPHLSEERHRRLLRVLLHPLLDWIIVHHRLVALIAALIVLAAAGWALSRWGIINEGTPIWIRFRGSATPEGMP